jgi:hypothetical protein
VKHLSGYRLIVSVVVLAMLAGAVSWQTHAQSEYLRGDRMPYDAFDKLPKTDLDVPSGVIHVAFAPGDLALPKSRILQWVTESARAVSLYYGRFPVKSLRLLFVPVDGGGVQGGTTWGYRGGAIRIPLGREVTVDELGSLQLALGRARGLCRTGRPRAGRGSYRQGNLVCHGAGHAQGPAAGGR